MSWMKKGAIGAGALVGVGVLGGGATMVWANQQVDAIFDQQWETHDVDFPVPFPLTEQEIEALRTARAASEGAAGDSDLLADLDLEGLALERAIARGEHFAESIYACTACHGSDLTGGVMVHDDMVMILHGPDITHGGATADYQVADWDRAIRHGVLPDGSTSMMPVRDFKNLSDRELSDLIAYIQSLPAGKSRATVRTFGPVGTMLLATGQLMPDTFLVPDHQAEHTVRPPPVGPTVEYGTHITTVCLGCHKEDLAGGTITQGPPDWPPSRNLTPHEEGLKGWTFEDFDRLMREGKRPNGENTKAPMSEMAAFAKNFTEDEMRAMYLYLQQLEPLPTGR